MEGYKSTLVDIDKFIHDPFYLGNVFMSSDGKRDKIFPIWIEALEEIFPIPYFSPFSEIGFGGPIGSGKTSISRIILLYDLYKLLMLTNPFEKFNFIESDAIIIALFTANLTLADIVLYEPFRTLIRRSPFFKSWLKMGRRDMEEGPIRFPNKIEIVAGSRFSHALGQAIFTAMLDEVNFQGALKNQALDSYTSLSRRMESRFMEIGGTVPGHLILISSKKEENAFLDDHIDKNRNRPDFKVYEYPIWEVRKHTGIYSGITFPIFVGDRARSPKILKEDEVSKYPSDLVIRPPMEYHNQFLTNIQKALADTAGISGTSISKYIIFPEIISKAIKVYNVCSHDYVYLELNDDARLIDYVDTAKLMVYVNQYPLAPRVIHLDIGVAERGDACGVAMAACVGHKETERIDNEKWDINTGLFMQTEPIARVEFVIGIKTHSRVPIFKLRNFITDLTELGVPIAKVTADSFESEDTMQLMTRMGLNTEIVSMDINKIPHITFRNAITEGRVELPEHPILQDEFLKLIDTGKKFDHSIKASKDLSDAVVGACYSILTETTSSLQGEELDPFKNLLKESGFE